MNDTCRQHSPTGRLSSKRDALRLIAVITVGIVCVVRVALVAFLQLKIKSEVIAIALLRIKMSLRKPSKGFTASIFNHGRNVREIKAP